VARSESHVPSLPENQHDIDFSFVGLVGLKDPIRDQVPQAVEECYRAGVRVVMITGDYPVTACNVGMDIGIDSPHQIISGQELDAMSDDILNQRIKGVNIFARVVPEQKLTIVHALKNNHEVVAMTGDGVNDAPALKASDIGIAMGEKGTDVARESCHLVLMDDDFSSIVQAMKMGRRIFDNLQKALAYTFAIHVPITGLAMIPVFFKDLPLMLWPVHVVFLELIIDPACSIIFEAEQDEKNVMNRPPKPIHEPFFSLDMIMMSCTQGLFILLSVFLVYGFCVYQGYVEREVRSLTFTCMIAANIATILSNRSWTRTIFQILVTPNPTVKWVIGGAIFFLVLVLNIPLLLDLFRFAPIGIIPAAMASLTGILSICWFEWYKMFRMPRKQPKSVKNAR
jgi:P-type Ca2+ transporter type 2C